MARRWQLLILAGALLAPTAALADEKDGEKQRRERSGQQYRVLDGNDHDRNDRGRVWEDNANGGDNPRTSGNEKQWRKDQKEREKDRREVLKEREKDQREALKEREKNRQEAAREYDKDRREAQRENEKDRRAAGKDGRESDNQRYSRPTTRP